MRPSCLIVAFAVVVSLPAAPEASVPAVEHGVDAGVVRPLESIRFEQDEDVKCLVSALETGDAAQGPSTYILKAPPGCIVPWHFHTAQEQAIVIHGQVKMEMEGHPPATLGNGGFAMMPGKVPHQFSCVSQEPCVLIVAFDARYDISWGKKN
jgi:quercetin dioxygenase-like cupin family protein